jgi:hypothetical protein
MTFPRLLPALSAALVLCASNWFPPKSAAQTVINIPPSQPILQAPANTIVNVLPGGELYGGFQALEGSTVNIAGGNAPNIHAQFGSQVNVSDGSLIWIQLQQNSIVNMSGGLVSDQIFSYGTLAVTGGRIGSMVLQPNGEEFHSTGVISGGAIGRITTTPGAALTIEGVGFALNGELVAGLTNVGDTVTVDLSQGGALTGILADGRAFGHGEWIVGYPSIASGTLTLRRSAAPATPPPGEIVATSPSPLEWIGVGQTLRIQQGGRMPRLFRAGPGSEVIVEGGYTGEDFHSVGAAVTVQSGGIESRFKSYDGSVITLNGGRIAEADYFHGSVLNMHGGEAAFQRVRAGAVANIHGGVLYTMYADDGSTVNVHGGERVEVSSGGKVNIFGGNVRLSVGDGEALIAGGTFYEDFQVAGSSALTIQGSDFRLNGIPLGGLQNLGDVVNVGNVKPQDVLSGVLSDGTPFALSPQEADDLPIVFQVRRGPDLAPGPAVINVPSVPAPLGVRSGQTLNLSPGGSLGPNFVAGRGSTVNITGGTVGENFDAIGAIVNVTGGKLHWMTVFSEADVTLGGTSEWGDARVRRGGRLTVDGDSRGSRVLAEPGSVVNIRGGILYGIEARETTLTFDGETTNGSYIEGGTLTVTGGHLRGVTLNGANAIATGGAISGARLQDQGKLNVQGAAVGGVDVGAGTLFEMDAGSLGSSFAALGTMRIRGGALGDRHDWYSGLVELHGDDFQVDGVPVAGLSNVGDTVVFNYAPGTHFSGTLADGTPFAFEGMDNFQSLTTSNSALRLVRSAIAPTPDLNVPNDPAPDGAAPGQRVVVDEGGALGDHFVAGRDSHVEIRGGMVGVNFEVDRSVATMSGGAVGEHLDVLAGGVLNVSGGTIDRHWQVWEGGTLNVSGGELNFQGAVDGGRINQSGGVVHGLEARGGAEVIVSGGSMASELKLYDAARATINGGETDILRIHAGGAAQVSGGRVRYFNLEADATGKVLGGVVNQLNAETGSTIEVAGGSLGDDLNVEYASNVTLRGVGFAINGAAVPGLDAVDDEVQIAIGDDDVFSGTWADGTPFVMTGAEGERLGDFRLVRSAEPAAGPPLIDVAAPSALRGVRSGQHVRLSTGGSLGEHFSAGSGSAVTITGGSIDRNFEAYDANVSISGGQIAAQFGAFGASRVQMTGGQIAVGMAAYAGSEVEISGGHAASIAVRTDASLRVSGGVVDRVTSDAGGSFELSGGSLGRLSAAGGSHNVWRGGSVENLTTQGATTSLSIHGSRFHLNGAPLELGDVGSALKINVRRWDVLTGVLADGTPLALRPTSTQGTFFNDGTVQVVLSATPHAPQPGLEIVTQDRSRALLGEGQQLLLKSGRLGSGSIAGYGSVLTVEGGTLGQDFRAAGATVDIRGGTILTGFAALNGTDLLVTGGQFTSGLILTAGSHASIFGGQFFVGSHHIESGAVLDLFGVSFQVDGHPIAELAQVGSSMTLTQRGQSVLTATLLDGTTTHWNMFTGNVLSTPMSPNAVVRLHRIAPSDLPGDFDDNGIVDGNDFLVWQREDGRPAYLVAWKARFGERLGASPTRGVPEPGTAGMMLEIALGIATINRKRGRADC